MWANPNDQELLFSKLSEGEKVSGVEVKLKQVNGGLFDALIYAEPITVNNEDCIFVDIQDISERKMLAERLKQSEKLSAIGQLAGGIAHDFNNQLTGILGYAEIIKNTYDEEKLKEYASTIISCANHSAELTKQLLAFSRKGKAEAKTFDITSIVSEVVDVLTHSVSKKISIVNTLGIESAFVTGAPSQIQNALLNLGVNARDAIHGKGSIHFETKVTHLSEEYCSQSSFNAQSGDYIQVNVIDTGTGMPEEVQRKMFEPFFTTKDEGKGTGMGLAAVYGTIANHNGFIDVSSVIGQGTTVSLFFPLAETEHKGSLISDPALTHGRGFIMLVDDEAVIRKLGCEMLRQLGYKVVTFIKWQGSC